MALSKTTQDHGEIQRWAETRGAVPAEVESTEINGQTGILRIEFPKAKNANDSALKEISWEEFFEKFDASGLALVFQELTADGEQSNFNKLIYPEAPESKPSKKASTAGGSSSAKKSSAQKKTATQKSSPKGAVAAQGASKAASAKKSEGVKSTGKSAPAKSAAKSPASKAAKKTSKIPAKSSAKKAAKTPAKKAATKAAVKAPARKSPARKASGARSGKR